MTELQMAMIVAGRCYTGTSIVEGAISIMRQVRQMSPEQFREKPKSYGG